MKLSIVCSAVILALIATGCDLVDPVRPTPHADTETFGNLLEVMPDPERGGAWIVHLRVGVPRALGRTDDARPTPDIADGILAVVTVTDDTVVTVDDRPIAVEEIGPGTEVVAIPVPGTTLMLGEKETRFEASQLMDFATYARWRLPKLELPGWPAPVEDVDRINSAGAEHGPVPVGDGRVLYFVARLRRPVEAEGEWAGAKRDGLRPAAADERSYERSFRTELGPEGWTTPELVRIPGTEAAAQVQVTWVGADERSCFVTVAEPDAEPWIGISERESASEPWGEVAPFEPAAGGDAFGAVAMTSSPEKTVFVSTRSGGGDLYLHDPAMDPARPLQPAINTAKLEWSPQIGPADELYFVRGERQLRFQNGAVHEVRAPGPHRTVLIEASPTSDGRWLFLVAPRLRPVELDLDIVVAPLAADGSLGDPVPVDDWRP